MIDIKKMLNPHYENRPAVSDFYKQFIENKTNAPETEIDIEDPSFEDEVKEFFLEEFVTPSADVSDYIPDGVMIYPEDDQGEIDAE